MNTTTLRTTVRRKRVWIPAVATVAVLGVGGAGMAYAAVADDSQPVTGADRDRIATAAVEEVGGGEALSVETSDDRGEAYEVDVLDAEGVEWSIGLADDLSVVDRDRDDDLDDRDGRGDDDRDDDDRDDDDRDDGPGQGPDSDDVPVTGSEREEVAEVAVEEIGSGEATQVERTDDAPEAFEVEVVDEAGDVWDVTLDADLAVLSRERDS